MLFIGIYCVGSPYRLAPKPAWGYCHSAGDSPNLSVELNQPGQWVDKIHNRKPVKEIILDMDSSDSPTFARQEGSAYNSHN